jgi:hypothetical protein
MDAGSLAAPLTFGIEHKHGPRQSRRRGPWNGLDMVLLMDIHTTIAARSFEHGPQRRYPGQEQARIITCFGPQ